MKSGNQKRITVGQLQGWMKAIPIYNEFPIKVRIEKRYSDGTRASGPIDLAKFEMSEDSCLLTAVVRMKGRMPK